MLSTIYKQQFSAIISLSFILSATSTPASVLDVTGNNLHTGISYYASTDSRGGGITLAPNDSCPRLITIDSSPGLPLTFTPVHPNKGVIHLSTDVNIKFSGSATCNQSNVWKLDYDEAKNEFFVVVGGIQGNPGRQTVDNWFKIEKAKDGYKLVFCPTVCNFCKVLCKDVGIIVDDNGRRRLALSDLPFSVMFKR